MESTGTGYLLRSQPGAPEPQNGNAALLSALQGLGWPAKAAAELTRGAHTLSYEKRAQIFGVRESADLVYILLSGEVKLEFQAPQGARLLVSIARSGQMLGVLVPVSNVAPAGDHPEQFFSAHALSRCRVAIIPASRIVQALHRLSPDQVVHVLDRSREQWTRLSCRLLSFLTMTVRERLTHVIDEIADSFSVLDARGRMITLRLSHDDFAALVGASRPMVSKHLKELSNQGVLKKQQGRYVVTGHRLSDAQRRDLIGDSGEQAGNGDRATSGGRRMIAPNGARRPLRSM